MNQTDWKYIVDVFMFISMLGIIVIGLLMAFVMDSGPMRDESAKYFLGLHRHQWGTFHLYLSLFFTSMLFFHLVLEWSWIKGKSRKLFQARWKHALWTATGLALFILILFWIFTPKYPVEYQDYGRGQRRPEMQLHTETAFPSNATRPSTPPPTGIRAEKILAAMGLPPDLSKEEALGRQRRRYGFTLPQLRGVIADLMEKK